MMEHVGTFQDAQAALAALAAAMMSAVDLLLALREAAIDPDDIPDRDELLLDDIRAVVTGPPPSLPGLSPCQSGAVEQHTVKAGGS